MTLQSFLKRVRDLKGYRDATRDMHSRYPTATAEQLGDGVCIVCREEMVVPQGLQEGPGLQGQQQNEEPKVLPCGHVFHFRYCKIR